jgi:3-mercaptopyruvate sulfurtransferase SseA
LAGVELATGDYKPTVLKGSQNIPPSVSPAELSELLKTNSATLVDVSASSSYAKAHVSGAWFVIRARLAESIKMMAPSERFVVTGDDASLTAFTAHDLATLTGKPVSVLAGGNGAWRKAGLPLKSGMEKPGSVVDDLFVQPFLFGHLDPESPEFRKAADDYISWELQLPEQLDRAKETDFKLAGK